MNSITPQMADGYLAKLNQRYGLAFIGPRMSSESLMRSLELLRINVQQAFNKEIDTVVRNFMDVGNKFWRMAETFNARIFVSDLFRACIQEPAEQFGRPSML